MDRDTDIFDLLTDDHDEVVALFDELDRAEAMSPSATESFSRLSQALDAHLKAEEDAFYPVLSDREETRRFIGDALDDHSRARDVVLEIAGLTVGSDAWRAKLLELRALFEDHVTLTEDELFERVRGVFDDTSLRDLARRFTRAKDAHPAHRAPSAA